jgi:hypothetical protein
MQRSIEVYDKLLSLLITFVCVVLCVQAIGLEVKSLLTISGFGGLAIGLAGREILENLFSGLLILSSRSFEVGEEIMFTQVRGHVLCALLNSLCVQNGAFDSKCSFPSSFWLLIFTVSVACSLL